jgi:hypothetical protein
MNKEKKSTFKGSLGLIADSVVDSIIEGECLTNLSSIYHLGGREEISLRNFKTLNTCQDDFWEETSLNSCPVFWGVFFGSTWA